MSGDQEGTRDIAIGLIYVDPKKRIRQVDWDYVRFIAESMAERGLLTEIEVRPIKKAGFWYELVAGEHRLEAAKSLEWDTIRASVKKSDDLEAELRQIDENLIRRDLNSLDRANFLARRQVLHLQMYPDTGQGKGGAAHRWHATDKLSFASEIAGKLGVSDRDIRRSIARATKIVDDVREKIAGTWIAANGPALDALVRLGPSDQRKVITLMLQPGENRVRSVSVAMQQISGQLAAVPDVDADQLNRLMEAWRKAGTKAKRQFIEWLDEQGTIGVVGLGHAGDA